MKKIALIFILPLFIYSCNDAKDDKEDKSLQKVSLNEQSLQCIAILNRASAEQEAAMQAGDQQKIASSRVTMDSAARENALIGKKLMEMDNEAGK